MEWASRVPVNQCKAVDVLQLAKRLSTQSRAVWSIALPAMITNFATALFGLADMWVIGRLGDASAQGAVELGAKFMLAMLNIFNFLRTSTVALTAQSTGRGDVDEQGATLARAATTAMGIGAVMLIAMPLAIPAGLNLLGAHGSLAQDAATYIGIRYWAGPFWLVNCAFTGWLIGQRQVRQVLAVEVAANVLHIALDLLFVLVLHWGIAGVATATFTSELFKSLALAAVVMRRPGALGALAAIRRPATWHRRKLAALFSLNRDLFLRTFLLTAVMLLFARVGAKSGPIVLAANGILFQLFMLSTLILDGFESAAQVLCGEALGAGQRSRFTQSLRATLLWGSITGLAISVIYAFAGEALLAQFSTNGDVISHAAGMTPWLVALPMAGCISFVLDGVFVGAGWTRSMLVAMALSMASYAGLLLLLQPWGNAGLWTAFVTFFVIRGGVQILLVPPLVRKSF